MCVFDSYSILINYKNFAKNIFYLIFFKSTIYFLSQNWMEKKIIRDYKVIIASKNKAWNPPFVIKQGKNTAFSRTDLHITTNLKRFNSVNSHLRQKYHYMKIPQGCNSNQSKTLFKDFFFLAILKIEVIARRETTINALI